MFKAKRIIYVVIYTGIIMIASRLTSYALYDGMIKSSYEEIQIPKEEVEDVIMNTEKYKDVYNENLLISYLSNNVSEVANYITETQSYSYNDENTSNLPQTASVNTKSINSIQTMSEKVVIENESIPLSNYTTIPTSNYIETKEVSYDDIPKILDVTEWVTDEVYFRTEPSKAAEIKMILVPGDSVTVMNYKGDWAFCSVDGKLGWILNEFLSEEEYIPHKVSLGYFKITHYCSCTKCCGPNAKGITSTGAVATVGTTIAVDPTKIPYGTKVEINGHEYIAQDCGGGVKQNHIDIFCSSHEEALSKGTYTVEVFQIND